MHERITSLRELEPKSSGRSSYQAILEAAAGLFEQFKAVDITLRDILNTSGVANQTLYNYFPNGRDDVAIVLQDRIQQVMIHDFHQLLESSGKGEDTSAEEAIRATAACLAGAVFNPLKARFTYQTSLHQYLKTHGLLDIANHTKEFETAFQAALTARHGNRFSKADLPRIVHLCVHFTRELVAIALENPQYPPDVLEANARMFVRDLLHSGMKDREAMSSGILLKGGAAAPFEVPPARISEPKRESIFNRILRRRKPK